MVRIFNFCSFKILKEKKTVFWIFLYHFDRESLLSNCNIFFPGTRSGPLISSFFLHENHIVKRLITFYSCTFHFEFPKKKSFKIWKYDHQITYKFEFPIRIFFFCFIVFNASRILIIFLSMKTFVLCHWIQNLKKKILLIKHYIHTSIWLKTKKLKMIHLNRGNHTRNGVSSAFQK